uniref:Uncharacterized protein n=1 Tax=Clastoptera arizonana TaxID=38151 RepID=A0A1B6E5X2_9HEMI
MPEETIKARKCTFWTLDKNGEVGDINRNHHFYYQIQGQLRVTRRQFCYFTLWLPKGIKITKIDRDDEFWKEKMFPKLERFYMDCLLPELIDPRHNRSMPIRNPSYIEEA